MIFKVRYFAPDANIRKPAVAFKQGLDIQIKLRNAYCLRHLLLQPMKEFRLQKTRRFR